MLLPHKFALSLVRHMPASGATALAQQPILCEMQSTHATVSIGKRDDGQRGAVYSTNSN